MKRFDDRVAEQMELDQDQIFMMEPFGAYAHLQRRVEEYWQELKTVTTYTQHSLVPYLVRIAAICQRTAEGVYGLEKYDDDLHTHYKDRISSLEQTLQHILHEIKDKGLESIPNQIGGKPDFVVKFSPGFIDHVQELVDDFTD